MTLKLSRGDAQGVEYAKQFRDEINKHQGFSCRLYIGKMIPGTELRNISITITSEDAEHDKVMEQTILQVLGDQKLLTDGEV